MTNVRHIPPIVCVAPVEYHGLRQRPQVLMDLFAGLSPVFYLDPVGLRSFRIADTKRIVNKLLALPRPGNRVAGEHRPTIVTPPFIPFACAEGVNQLCFRHLGRSLRRKTDRMGKGKPLLWIGVPSPLALQLLDHFPHGTAVYDCMDDFPGFHGGAERIVRAEREILNRVDIVFAASVSLLERVEGSARKALMAPNGVDIERFRRSTRPVARPRDLPDRGTVIGYHGTIGQWFDADLVARIAMARPRWQVVLIGPVTCPLDRSRFPPNVHLLGPREQSRLPEYLAHFDVGIVPFARTPVAYHSNPIKVYEYLAAGLPVVASPIRELGRLRGLVREAGDAGEFVRRIEEALAEARDEKKRKERIAEAEAHSWSGVFAGILQEIEHLLDRG